MYGRVGVVVGVGEGWGVRASVHVLAQDKYFLTAPSGESSLVLYFHAKLDSILNLIFRNHLVVYWQNLLNGKNKRRICSLRKMFSHKIWHLVKIVCDACTKNKSNGLPQLYGHLIPNMAFDFCNPIYSKKIKTLSHTHLEARRKNVLWNKLF